MKYALAHAGVKVIAAGVTIAQKGGMMRYSGVVLQVVALLTIALCVLAGIAQLVSDVDPTSGGIIIVSTVVGGTLLFGIGGVFRTLADIGDDVRRSARANERTAEASERRAEALDRLATKRAEPSTRPDAPQRVHQPNPDVELPQQR
jgi:hypothetical protein